MLDGNLILEAEQVESQRGGVHRADNKSGRPCTEDRALHLPEEETAPVFNPGELVLGRMLDREMQEQLLARQVGRWPPDADFARGFFQYDGLESKARIGHQHLLERRALRGRGNHQHLDRRAIARQGPERRQVLHQAQRLGAHECGQRFGRYVRNAFQAREAQPAVFHEALPQAGAVHCYDQTAAGARAEPRRQRRREQRNRIDTRQPGAGGDQRFDPRSELIGIGE